MLDEWWNLSTSLEDQCLDGRGILVFSKNQIFESSKCRLTPLQKALFVECRDVEPSNGNN